MSQSPFDAVDSDILSQFLNKKMNATNKLLKSDSDSLLEPSDSLSKIAAKRGEDKVRWTQFFLQNRLSRDLDATMSKEFQKHPELKDKIYVGIILDEEFSAEVIPIEQAAASVEGMEAEEAQQQLQAQPIGYFNRQDFTLKTPSDEAFQSFKKGLQEFFQRNSDLISYLRNNPEANIQAEDLYTERE